ncbi:hypothetical protein LRC484719_43520 [Mycobacterium riyadhense]
MPPGPPAPKAPTALKAQPAKQARTGNHKPGVRDSCQEGLPIKGDTAAAGVPGRRIRPTGCTKQISVSYETRLRQSAQLEVCDASDDDLRCDV